MAIMGKVAKLRPTQVCVGFDEAAEKRKELESLSPKKLDALLQSKTIPCVLGPGEHLYLIDHHHMGLALTQMGHNECYVDVVHDLSTVPESKFYGVMNILELLYPHGPSGEQLPIYRIPKHLNDLIDDPYRSLAGFVRSRGGYVKTDTPYSEFVWANFFRDRIRIKTMDQAIEDALKLSASDQAKNMPGFIG